MLEIISVLVIMGLLSISGLYFYSRAMNQVSVNNIVEVINQSIVLVESELMQKSFETPEAMDNFLQGYSREIGGYEVVFYAPKDNFTGKEYVFEVRVSDDKTFDKDFCKALITTLVSNKEISSIMLNANNQEGNTVTQSLVDVDAFCNG